MKTWIFVNEMHVIITGSVEIEACADGVVVCSYPYNVDSKVYVRTMERPHTLEVHTSEQE